MPFCHSQTSEHAPGLADLFNSKDGPVTEQAKELPCSATKLHHLEFPRKKANIEKSMTHLQGEIFQKLRKS